MKSNEEASTTSSSSSYTSYSSTEQIQLGFCIPIQKGKSKSSTYEFTHYNPNWMKWDGGKVGGSPCWLQPENTPRNCEKCQSELLFLVQIYCPTNDTDAFHRTLYVFICPNYKICCNDNLSEGIVVNRCQLPRENPYYNYDSSNESLSCFHEQIQEFKKLLPEYELVVEEEPPPIKEKYKDHELIEENNEEDEQLTQSKMNEMTHLNSEQKTDDELTLEFQTRIHDRQHNVQTQVLRYNRWTDDKILWIQSKQLPTSNSIPHCSYCGAERKFEFQIMPQLLYYLQPSQDVKKKNENEKKPNLKELLQETESNLLDWGVIAIYTCVDSCNGNDVDDCYLREYAWLQPSPE